MSMDTNEIEGLYGTNKIETLEGDTRDWSRRTAAREVPNSNVVECADHIGPYTVTKTEAARATALEPEGDASPTFRGRALGSRLRVVNDANRKHVLGDLAAKNRAFTEDPWSSAR
jgi:hypothetical protein